MAIVAAAGTAAEVIQGVSVMLSKSTAWQTAVGGDEAAALAMIKYYANEEDLVSWKLPRPHIVLIPAGLSWRLTGETCYTDHSQEIACRICADNTPDDSMNDSFMRFWNLCNEIVEDVKAMQGIAGADYIWRQPDITMLATPTRTKQVDRTSVDTEYDFWQGDWMFVVSSGEGSGGQS